MYKLGIIIKLELLLYKRNIWLWLTIAILYGYLFLGYQAYLSSNIEVGQMLQSTSYIGMSAIIVGFLMGMLTVRKDYTYGFAESLSAIPGDRLRIWAKLLAWLIVVLSITVAAFLVMLALVAYSGSEFITFWNMILSYIFLYWGMPLLCSGIIGIAFEMTFPSRWWSLMVLLIFWIAVSPLNQMIMLLATHFHFSIDMLKWINLILSYINLGERDLELAYRNVQGWFISFDVWMKRTFFLCFSTLLVCLAIWLQKHRVKTRIEMQVVHYIAIVCLVFMIATAVLGKTPLDGSGYVDYEDYYSELDEEFYRSNPVDNVTMPPEGITVKQYTIELTPQNHQIAYHADMTIAINKSIEKWLPLTLYHGLKISDMKLGEETAQWQRNGDRVSIYCPGCSGDVKLSLEVKGHTGALHPIIGRSYFLAADFPWLPIAENLPVASLSNASNTLQYYSMSTEKAEYHITVHSSKQVFSNLPQIEPNVFAGTGKGAALLSGTLIREEGNSLSIVYPPDRPVDELALITKLNQKSDKISSILNTDKKDWSQDLNNIFVVPFNNDYSVRTMMRFTNDSLYLNHSSILGDYLASAEIVPVFYTLFWEGKLRERDEHNFIIMSSILEYLDSSNRPHLLKEYADYIKRLGDNASSVQVLIYKLMTAYDQGKTDEVEALLRECYLVLKHKELSVEEWEVLVNEKLAGDAK